MESFAASIAFSTLGHPGRLAVFRLLMRHAPHGVRPTEIAQALGLKANTLSHYLAELGAAHLVHSERRGRSLFYAADLDMAEGLLAYLALDVSRARPDILTPLLGGKSRMERKRYNVLFICTGNSARSIFAEALLRDLGASKFNAYSAGVRPGTALNPFALEVLARNGHDTAQMRSKHISEFQSADAPVMDFVFTVCDTAASEDCPPWEGQPITGHWGLPDPVKAQGTDAEKALVFAQTYGALQRRIAAFVELPFASLDRISTQSQVDAIGTKALKED